MDVLPRSGPALQNEAAAVTVWDLPVRLFHWLLFVAVSVAAITGFLLPANWLAVHLIAGSAIAGLVLFRLLWGFTGSTYSRFSSFLPKPSAIVSHIRHIREGHVVREPGHNPLGALMVFALLLCLALLVLTGTMLLGGVFKQGPLKSLLSFADGWQYRAYHEYLAYGVLALVVMHVAGVIFESRRSAENLAASMVTGRKRGGFPHVLADKPVKALAAMMGIVILGAGVTGGVVELSSRPPLGVRAVTADPVWARECAACHMAFPPSLLPAESWKMMMADLSNHFGEDASLDEATTAQIAGFLVANAAETQDTLAANRLRRVDPERPMEITATPFWKRMHQDIPDALFASRPVGAKQNCAACHADAATGWFAPQSIAIPEETSK